MSSSESQREALLEAAHYNVLRLDPADIEVDLMSDVPRVSPVAAVREAMRAAAAGPVRTPDLQALSEAIYGPARYVHGTMGRSAEAALFQALSLSGAVITNGLFRTTQHQISRFGGEIEVAPRWTEGSSDIEPAWLEARLGQGPVAAVVVETSNNSLGGWPMSLDNVEALAGACRARGVPFLLDATRLLSNCALFDADVLALARRFTEQADAFWVSCAKELMTPTGSLVGVRELGQQRAVWHNLFEAGCELQLQAPAGDRASVGAGLEHLRAHPEVVVDRRRQLELLAAELDGHSIPHLTPVGAHAVYVVCGPQLGPMEMERSHALHALLYRIAGVRALVLPNPRFSARLMRIPVAMGAHADDRLVWLARQVRAFFDRVAEAPTLRKVASECLHEGYLGHFERVAP